MSYDRSPRFYHRVRAYVPIPLQCSCGASVAMVPYTDCGAAFSEEKWRKNERTRPWLVVTSGGSAYYVCDACYRKRKRQGRLLFPCELRRLRHTVRRLRALLGRLR